MGIDEKMLGPVTDPADRLAQALCRFENQRIFAIDEALGTKPSADIGRDDAQIDIAAENAIAYDVALAMHPLRTASQRETIGVFFVFADCRPRFHVIGDETVLHEVN